MQRHLAQPEDIPITQQSSIIATRPVLPQPPQPRARGRLHVSTKRAGQRSVLDALHQSGSAKCLFPRSPGRSADSAAHDSAAHTGVAYAGALEAVFLNTAGGITGGDQFSFSAQAAARTQLTITTQACERAYRAQPDETGEIRTDLRVAAGGRLNWLPQETILFQGCAVDRRLDVDLEAGAEFLMVEPLVFGRTAMGEILTQIDFRDRIEIRRRGLPLVLDAMQLSGNVADHLQKPFIAGGAGAMALVVYVAPDAAAHLDSIRRQLSETGGASLLHEDALILRLLAPDSFLLRQTLMPVLKRLNGAFLPRCWMT